MNSPLKLTLPEELRDNRAVQFLGGLMPFLLTGVLCAALVRRPLGAWLFGALTLTGMGMGGWLTRRKPITPDVSTGAQRSDANTRRDSPRVAAEFARGRADTVLVIELTPAKSSTQGDAANLLASVQPFSESQADSSVRFEPRDLPQNENRQLGSWTLMAHAGQVVARFIQIPVAAESQANGRRVTSTVLRQMRLHRRIFPHVLGTMFTGQSVATGPLKAVVLCCGLADVRRNFDAMLTAAGRELDAIGQDTGGYFPVYIVATDLQEVGGFEEFATAVKSRFGASFLDQAIGVALDRDQPSKDVLRRHVLDVSARLATLRTALLHAIDQQSSRDTRSWASDSVIRKAQVYEFPRQLAMFSTTFTDFCWRAITVAQGNERGPMLRGVFFTGLVMPDVNPFMRSMTGPVQFERRAFAWNLLTKHLAWTASEAASALTD